MKAYKPSIASGGVWFTRGNASPYLPIVCTKMLKFFCAIPCDVFRLQAYIPVSLSNLMPTLWVVFVVFPSSFIAIRLSNLVNEAVLPGFPY